jgi:SAM-dependent methyltransferase
MNAVLEAGPPAPPGPVEPDPVLVKLVAALPPADAVDLGCGPGRNAAWLARHGWDSTGVDASRAGLDQAHQRATDAGVTINTVRSSPKRASPTPSRAWITSSASPPFLRLQYPRSWAHESRTNGHRQRPAAAPAGPRSREHRPALDTRDAGFLDDRLSWAVAAALTVSDMGHRDRVASPQLVGSACRAGVVGRAFNCVPARDGARGHPDEHTWPITFSCGAPWRWRYAANSPISVWTPPERQRRSSTRDFVASATTPDSPSLSYGIAASGYDLGPRGITRRSLGRSDLSSLNGRRTGD